MRGYIGKVSRALIKVFTFSVLLWFWGPMGADAQHVDCTKTDASGNLVPDDDLIRLKDSMARLSRMEKEAKYLREVRRFLDETNKSPTAKDFQDYSSVIRSHADSVALFATAFQADVQSSRPTWDKRQDLLDRLAMAETFYRCIAFETHYRFQNEQTTRDAQAKINAAWTSYAEALMAAANQLYANSGIVHRVQHATSDAQLDLLKQEVGPLLTQGAARRLFFGRGPATHSTKFQSEFPQVIAARKIQLDNKLVQESHVRVDQTTALAAFRKGDVPGWYVIDETSFFTISKFEGMDARVQTVLSCNPLYGIPTITLTATIDPETRLSWNRPSRTSTTTYASINNQTFRASQPFYRSWVLDPSDVNQRALKTTNTVNVFSFHFVDDNAGRRTLDEHIQRFGRGGKRHPAESKLYAPWGGYANRAVGTPFRLFERYHRLDEHYGKDRVLIGGKLGRSKRTMQFIDIGGADGPLTMAANACFGGIAPKFKDRLHR